MPYDKKSWKRRLAERSDLSSQLVHLTRETEAKKVVEVLFDILSDQKLIGSSTKSGYICGKRSAVCFQDSPLTSICQNVFFEQKYVEQNKGAKHRYRAVGIAIDKHYAYVKGARPVLYDKTADAKQLLPESEWWRIVNFDLSNEKSFVDWTHEREWRCPSDFDFELKEVTLLFVNEGMFQAFLQLCKKHEKNYLEMVKGIVVMNNLLY